MGEISTKVIRRHQAAGMDRILDFSLKKHVISCLQKLVEIRETYMMADGLEKFLSNTIMERKRQSVMILSEVFKQKFLGYGFRRIHSVD